MPNKFFNDPHEGKSKGGPVNMPPMKTSSLPFVEKGRDLPGLPDKGRPKKFSGQTRVKTNVERKGTL